MNRIILIISFCLLLCMPSCQTQKADASCQTQKEKDAEHGELLYTFWPYTPELPVDSQFLNKEAFRSNCRLLAEYINNKLKSGVSVAEIRIKRRRPILHLCVVAGNTECVKHLVENGYNVNEEEYWTDSRLQRPSNDTGPHRTALHVAVLTNQPEMIVLLLSLGADPKLSAYGPMYPDVKKRVTPGQLAENLGYYECWYILKHNLRDIKKIPRWKLLPQIAEPDPWRPTLPVCIGPPSEFNFD